MHHLALTFVAAVAASILPSVARADLALPANATDAANHAHWRSYAVPAGDGRLVAARASERALLVPPNGGHVRPGVLDLYFGDADRLAERRCSVALGALAYRIDFAPAHASRETRRVSLSVDGKSLLDASAEVVTAARDNIRRVSLTTFDDAALSAIADGRQLQLKVGARLEFAMSLRGAADAIHRARGLCAGSVSAREIKRPGSVAELLAAYSKGDVIAMIQREGPGNVTVQFGGALSPTYNRPREKYVSRLTVASDLRRLGLTPARAAEAIDAHEQRRFTNDEIKREVHAVLRARQEAILEAMRMDSQ